MNFMPSGITHRPAAQRAVGVLGLEFRSHGPLTQLHEFYQQGCLKARLPRPAIPHIREAVTMNISGGVAGGDTLTTRITLGPGASASIASAAAERIYRALHTPAQITTTITLAAKAHLEYLPQETILFDGFALNRALTINLAPNATFLGVETLIFGRRAMGETLRTGTLRDSITLHRAGRLILQDMTRLEGPITAILARQAIANGAGAMASIIYAAPDSKTRLPHIRDALTTHHAGASILNDVLRVRLLAPDAASLRHGVIAALAACRNGQALPRVWQS